MKAMKCFQCASETRKYKCSKCLNYCCSAACYQAHKTFQNCSATPQEINKEEHSVIHKSEKSKTIVLPFSTYDTVESDKLIMLANNKILRDILRNKHLRQFLIDVDSAQNAWKAINAAMLEPLFVEFADECITIVDQNAEHKHLVE